MEDESWEPYGERREIMDWITFLWNDPVDHRPSPPPVPIDRQKVLEDIRALRAEVDRKLAAASSAPPSPIPRRPTHGDCH